MFWGKGSPLCGDYGDQSYQRTRGSVVRLRHVVFSKLSWLSYRAGNTVTLQGKWHRISALAAGVRIMLYGVSIDESIDPVTGKHYTPEDISMSNQKSEFSEFSYGFSFVENMIRNNPKILNAAPCFPNLRQEKDLGYDVKITMPGAIFFFQFKIPEVRTYRAREIKEFEIGNKFLECHLHSPYLRMPISTTDNFRQHGNLMKLETAKSKNSDRKSKCNRLPVFYATPMFAKVEDIDFRFRNGIVHHSSALFSPSEIDFLTDNDYPFVAYNMDFHPFSRSSSPSYGWICSRNSTRWDLSPTSTARALSNKKYVRVHRYSDIMRMANICIKKHERRKMPLRDTVDETLAAVEKEIIRYYLDNFWLDPLIDFERGRRILEYSSDEERTRFLNSIIYRARGYRSADEMGYGIQSDGNHARESAKLYDLQSKVRSYFGAELVIFQRNE